MSFVRFLPVFVAILCLDAAADPLQSAASWMGGAQPFDVASIEQNFGVKLRKQCAGQNKAYECVAVGDKLDLRWRADTEGGEAREGYLRLPLDGCVRRGEVENVLGTSLRFDANSVADRSQTVTLSGNRWSPGRLWRVSVAFDGDCARQLTIAMPAF